MTSKLVNLVLFISASFLILPLHANNQAKIGHNITLIYVVGPPTPQTNTNVTAQPITSTPSMKVTTASDQLDLSSDPYIVTKIQFTIATNSTLTKLHIDVNSDKGVVQLIGNVSNNDQLSLLTEIAASITGVKEVNTTKLTVNNKSPSEDLLITAKVKGTFIREKILYEGASLNPLNLITNNGVVTLTGSVANQALVEKAIELAKSVKGVDKIKSELIVNNIKN